MRNNFLHFSSSASPICLLLAAYSDKTEMEKKPKSAMVLKIHMEYLLFTLFMVIRGKMFYYFRFTMFFYFFTHSAGFIKRVKLEILLKQKDGVVI